jgi:hypothetical protein
MREFQIALFLRPDVAKDQTYLVPADTRFEVDIRRIQLFHTQWTFWVFLRIRTTTTTSDGRDVIHIVGGRVVEKRSRKCGKVEFEDHDLRYSQEKVAESTRFEVADVTLMRKVFAEYCIKLQCGCS